MELKWEHIEGYEGIYKVSNYGQVLNTKRNQLLKYWQVEKGYAKVHLFKEGFRKKYSIHQLVAKAFLPKKPLRCTLIMHLDDNPLNNRADNLKWGTTSDNIRDSIQKGRWKGIQPMGPLPGTSALAKYLSKLIAI
jgi:hypothetical protein